MPFVKFTSFRNFTFFKKSKVIAVILAISYSFCEIKPIYARLNLSFQTTVKVIK